MTKLKMQEQFCPAGVLHVNSTIHTNEVKAMPTHAPSRRRRRSPLLFPTVCLLFLLLGVVLGRQSMASAIPAACGWRTATSTAAR